MNNVVLANIIAFFAGICCVVSVFGKNKKQIVCVEFFSSLLIIISNTLVQGWSDALAKVVKALTQFLSLNNKLNKARLYIISFIYVFLCFGIIYITSDFRYLIAVVPSMMEFYSLLGRSAKKYRWYNIITKVFWTINNIVFKLYVGIFFDIIIVMGHFYKIKHTRGR